MVFVTLKFTLLEHNKLTLFSSKGNEEIFEFHFRVSRSSPSFEAVGFLFFSKLKMVLNAFVLCLFQSEILFYKFSTQIPHGLVFDRFFCLI